MKKGQHPRLLNELLRCLREHDPPRLCEIVEQAKICSDSPGTATYNNKCEFPDGHFVAVLEDTTGAANQLVWGFRRKEQLRAPGVIDRDPTEYEIREYALRMCPWVARQLFKTETSSKEENA